jgi:hypothetical protein
MKFSATLIILIVCMFLSTNILKANETLPGSFTVTEDNPEPIISNLGLYRASGQLITPNSGTMIPNTRHSIRFTVNNELFTLETYQVRVALFKSNNPTYEAFSSLKTDASGDALVINFTDSLGVSIEYQNGFDAFDHSFDNQFFNAGLDKIHADNTDHTFQFEIYFNMSKVVSFDDAYYVAVSFTQRIENKDYTIFDVSGDYLPASYTEISLADTALVWSLGDNESFDLFNYESDASKVIIPAQNLSYISNTSFDIEIYSDPVWRGQDLDDPNNIDAVVEAYLSSNPISDQTFGLKVNINGIPNSGVQLDDVASYITSFNSTDEYGSFGINFYIWLGIFGSNFQNGAYEGNLYVVFTQN